MIEKVVLVLLYLIFFSLVSFVVSIFAYSIWIEARFRIVERKRKRRRG